MRWRPASPRRALDGVRVAASAIALLFLAVPIRDYLEAPTAFDCLWCRLSVLALAACSIALWRVADPRARAALVVAGWVLGAAALWLLGRYEGGIYGAQVTLFARFYLLEASIWTVLATGVLEAIRIVWREVPWHRVTASETTASTADPAALSRSRQLSIGALSVLTLWVSIASAAPDRGVVPAGATLQIPFAGATVSYLGFEIVALATLLVVSLWMRVAAARWHALSPPSRGPAPAERLLDLLLRTGLPLVGVGALAWKALPRPEGVILAVLWSVFAIVLVLREGRYRAGDDTRWRRFSRRAIVLALGVIATLAVLERFEFRVPIIAARTIYRPVSARGASLANSDRRQRVLQRANLSRANLEGALLEGSDLWGARLMDARLRNTNLVDAHLVRAELQRADLRGAQLDDADLSRAVLYDADLRGAEGHWSLWEDANLSGADLREADLQESVWDMARIYGADFSNADLRGARFDATQLRDSQFRGAQLENAELPHANLRRADLEGANLRGALLRSVRFQGANLRGADLRDTRELNPRTIRATCLDASTRFPFDVSDLLGTRGPFCRRYPIPDDTAPAGDATQSKTSAAPHAERSSR